MNMMRRFSALFILAVLIFTFASAVFAEDADPVAARADEMIRKMREKGVDAKGGIVLVLSGGGTKGFAHVGVLKVLETMEIPIVGIVGTSMGSIIGGMYAAGLSADDIHDLMLDTNIMKLLGDSGTRVRSDAGDHTPAGETTTFLKTYRDRDFRQTGPLGILPARNLLGFLNQHTGSVGIHDFMKLPIPFACVAADIATGETVVLTSGSLPDAIRASASIPGLLEPWRIGDHLLVDGGLVANLPVAIAKDLFPGYPVVAVNLTSVNAMKQTFESFTDIMIQTIDVMAMDHIRQNEAMADIVIRPDVAEFSMIDPSGYDDIYERGVAAAVEMKDRMAAASAAAPAPPARDTEALASFVVRDIQVYGINDRAAREIVDRYKKRWLDKPYDPAETNRASDELSSRDDIESVGITVDRVADGVSVAMHITPRPAYEFNLSGYTSSAHPRRWFGARLVARSMLKEGDSSTIDGRWGNEEWGADLRYFTPLVNGEQWGFAISSGRQRETPYGEESYKLDRLSGRVMYYTDTRYGRFGLGVAGERTDSNNDDDFTWGPYAYYAIDTLDNEMTPRRGFALNSRVWWNTNDVWVSSTRIQSYIPIKDKFILALGAGLKTGRHDSQAYQALLGNYEELIGLAAAPYAGDQAAWARLGVGYDFYSSWWGALRGELFAAYGMTFDSWSRTRDYWESGVALSMPSRFLNARVFLVYGQDGELTTGFSLGVPTWPSRPLP